MASNVYRCATCKDEVAGIKAARKHAKQGYKTQREAYAARQLHQLDLVPDGRARDMISHRPLTANQFAQLPWHTDVTVWLEVPGAGWVIQRSWALGYLRDSGWKSPTRKDDRGWKLAVFEKGVNPNGAAREMLRHGHLVISPTRSGHGYYAYDYVKNEVPIKPDGRRAYFTNKREAEQWIAGHGRSKAARRSPVRLLRTADRRARRRGVR